jgi:tol-pal system protein YbgF
VIAVRALPPRAARAARPALAAALAVASAGCFATRNDVRLLQADVAAARAAAARADTLRAQQLDRVAAQLGVVSDSLRAIASRAGRFEGDAREGLREVREQLIQVQELTGQSQRRLQELRADMEQQREQQAAAAAASDSAGAPAPGPNQLYQLGTQQFGRGSYGAARDALGELLTRYPTADVAPDAQFFIAESFAAERNTAAADSAYAAVVTKYPASPRAATALYKRARQRQDAGRRADARTLFEEIVRRYPKSDEASLACDALGRRTGCPSR